MTALLMSVATHVCCFPYLLGPLAVSNLTAITLSLTSVWLTWDYSDESLVDHYQMDCYNDCVPTVSNTTSLLVDNLTSGQTYSFIVSAISYSIEGPTRVGYALLGEVIACLLDLFSIHPY